MTLSKAPGVWRWEQRGEDRWYRVNDDLSIEDGPHHRVPGKCYDGNEHGEIATALDNPVYFDPTILGPTPDDTLFGYCVDCHMGFRWSVTNQEWREWPGGMTSMPALTDEELEVLQIAVSIDLQKLRKELAQVAEVLGPAHRIGPAEHRVAVLQSLHTAIVEARGQLR